MRYRLLFFIAVFFAACKKEKSSVEYDAVESGTDKFLYSVRIISRDSIAACGGKDGSGIFLLSADKGYSWKILNDKFDQVIYDFYFTDTQTGFAAGGKPDVFKTVDGGITWEKISLPFPQTGFPLNYRVPLRRFFFANDSTGFICGGGGYEAGIIFKTFDSGETWSLNLFQSELRGISFLNQTDIVACGFGTIVKSADLGSTWKKLDAPNEYYTSLISVEGKLWACGYNGGIYFSADYGSSWQISDRSNNAYSSRSHFNCMGASEGGSFAAAGTDGVIAVSRDGGSSWEEGESFERTTIKNILLTDAHTGIAVGNDGKIFRFSF